MIENTITSRIPAMIRSNQRTYQRIPPPVTTVILTKDTFGHIINISPGGMSLKFIDLDTPVKKRDTLEILFGDLRMADVQVSLIWEMRANKSPDNSAIMSRAGLKFENLTAKQRVMLDFYINQHKEPSAWPASNGQNQARVGTNLRG
jgi:hypothetical protein